MPVAVIMGLVARNRAYGSRRCISSVPHSLPAVICRPCRSRGQTMLHCVHGYDCTAVRVPPVCTTGGHQGAIIHADLATSLPCMTVL